MAIPSPTTLQEDKPRYGFTSEIRQYYAARFYNIWGVSLRGDQELNVVLSREVSGNSLDGLSRRTLAEEPKPMYVKLSLDTSMSFAEAVAFFKRLVVPSEAIVTSLEYQRKFGGSFVSHKIMEDFPFRDLDPNLIQHIAGSGYIDMKLVGGKNRIHSTSYQGNLSIPPFIDYSQHRSHRTHEKKRRRIIDYKNTSDKIDEPTLEQILGVATIKLKPEDIAKLKVLIENAAEL